MTKEEKSITLEILKVLKTKYQQVLLIEDEIKFDDFCKENNLEDGICGYLRCHLSLTKYKYYGGIIERLMENIYNKKCIRHWFITTIGCYKPTLHKKKESAIKPRLKVIETLINHIENDEVTSRKKIYNEDDVYLGYTKVVGDTVFFTKIEKEKNRYKKLNAWTIHFKVLGLADVFVYKTEGTAYVINKENALQLGVFRELGGEEKLCVPVKYWEQYAKVDDTIYGT